MPVTEISGIAGTLGPGPDPLQAFAEHLQRAREQDRNQAMQQLDWMMKMTEQSGGRFTPDPKELEKVAKRAGLPKQILGGAGGAQSAFTGMAEHAGKMSQAQEAQAAATAEAAKHEQLLTKLESAAIDEGGTDESRAHAQTMLGLGGKRTLAQLVDAGVMQHLNPDQKKALVQAKEDELLGKPTEKDYDTEANKILPSLIDDYDGDTVKAVQAAGKLVRRESLPPELQPPMTDQRLKRDTQIAQHGVEMGWTPTMIAQAQAAKTTDTAALAKTYGWDKDLVDKLEPLKVREVKDKEAQTAAYGRMATAEERRVGIESEKAKADSVERVARAWKELAQAGNTKDPEMKQLTAQIENLRRLQTMKAPIPADTLKAVSDQLMKSLTDENGVPLMHEGDVPTFMGMGSSKGWLPGGPADPEATKSEKKTAPGSPEKSLTDPDVLKEFMHQFPGDAEKFLDSIPAGINKFGDWLDDFLAGGHASRGATGKF
jgi:hypothetical protein